MNDRSVIPTTIGYMCLGFTAWMGNLGKIGWITGANMQAAYTEVALCTVLLGLMAILCFVYGRKLDSIIFFGVVGFALCFFDRGLSTALLGSLDGGPLAFVSKGQSSGGASGWFAFLWAVFFFYLWIAAFKAGWARWLFLLCSWLGMLSHALLPWLHAFVFLRISGYVIMLAALIAIYISAATIINHSFGRQLLNIGSGETH